MDESLSIEYDKYFSNFYREFYKYQSGSKKHLKCDGCSTKKRFILNENQLIFSCGPKHNKDKKCGQQYTIDLPKYINFREFYKFYNEQINGSFDYTKNNLLEYDLKSLNNVMNVNDYLLPEPGAQSSLPIQAPQTPQPNPAVVTPPVQPAVAAQSGLTPTEEALLSPSEKAIRLRQRGLG